MGENSNLFGIWDYIVLLAVLLVSSGIGIYYRFTGGKQRTVKEYLLADSNLHVVPVAFSLVATAMSAITLLGISSESYTFGLQYIVQNITHVFCTPIVTYVYLPVFYQLRVTSVYEYLEKRFGKTTRLAASLTYSFQMILYSGIVLYAPALTLGTVTGISQNVAILSVGLICTFYSTIGGMKAVVMADLLQSVLMFGAVLSVIICGVVQTGSVAEIWRIADEGNRTGLLNFDIDPTVRHSWFSLIIGGGITFLSAFAINQSQIQKYLTVKDLKSAQQTIWLNLPIFVILSLSTSLSGLAIFSKYYQCDPIANKSITSSDQLMPYYVLDSMGHIPGLSGFFVAGIFSGSLSTISTSMNCLAAVSLEDYLKPLYSLGVKESKLSDQKLSLYTKIITFSYGLVCICIAFLSQSMGGIYQAALTVLGVVGGPHLGLFSLGMFTKTANEKGAMTGLILGLTLSTWMGFGEPRPPPSKLPVRVDGCGGITNISLPLVEKITERDYFWLYRLSYLYNGALGLICTFTVGFVASKISNKVSMAKPGNLDPNLFVPLVTRFSKKGEQNNGTV
ncbi:hypothetical protein RI129_004246 [Pyrocoelia pectoralis]|uniref:Sodium-dependent multivitamin transporter n=1 Tax=Pyrocoelia pectoralis TaxID=417401 RepID=A0AAN7ZJ42_9COLE